MSKCPEEDEGHSGSGVIYVGRGEEECGRGTPVGICPEVRNGCLRDLRDLSRSL